MGIRDVNIETRDQGGGTRREEAEGRAVEQTNNGQRERERRVLEDRITTRHTHRDETGRGASE